MQSIRSDDVENSQDEQTTVARELAPAGLQSNPLLFKHKAGPLRGPAGASSLATGSALRLQRGFTLIEIMVVVVIIGILGAIVVPQFMSRPDQAKVTAAKVTSTVIITKVGSILEAILIVIVHGIREHHTAQKTTTKT